MNIKLPLSIKEKKNQITIVLVKETYRILIIHIFDDRWKDEFKYMLDIPI